MLLSLDVTLRSDALFGASHGIAGAADVEAELETDTSLPFLRGRTLKGLLVEACADLLYAARAAQSPGLDRLQEAARFLFGRPGSDYAARGRLRVGAARLPASLRDAVREALQNTTRQITRTDVVEALTTLRRQTALDASGAPVKESLRSARLVTRGLTLEARLRFASRPSADALTLLAACARTVHRGGTNRTRGMGRIHLQLRSRAETAATPPDELWRGFAHLLRDEPIRLETEPPQAPDTAPALDAPSAAVALRYRLHLDEPVLVKGAQGDPNSTVGLDYLPGSTLRGAFVGRHLREQPVADLASDEVGRHLFFDGGIRFLNAYPVLADRRATPTPRSWFHDKGDEKTLVDFALDPEREVEKRGDDDKDPQWRRLGKAFVDGSVGGAGAVYAASPERHLALHIRRSRRVRIAAPAEDDRDVFRYDALDRGQTFEGVLLCADSASATRARAWLHGPLTLGGTTTAGYGSCSVSFVKAVPLDTFAELHAEASMPSEGTTMLVLLAPLLLRDAATGLHTTAPAALEHALSVATGTSVSVERAFTGQTLVGGFNRTWGLPLPQQRAFAAGSVFVVSASQQALQKLEEAGLGERRPEGFGRLAVAPWKWTECDRKPPPSVSAAPTAQSETLVDPQAAALARRILDAWLTRTLDRQILDTALSLAGVSRAPHKSQLARVRLHIRRTLDALPLNDDTDGALLVKEQDRLTAFLKALPQHAQTQFERARLGDGSLLDWLQARARGEGDLYDLLTFSSASVPALAGQEAKLSKTLEYRLHLRLAFATLTLIAKRLQSA
ncbi:MAG: RAMP superfamily CRISPR-associated protein [Pseudomonadota bacterium]